MNIAEKILQDQRKAVIQCVEYFSKNNAQNISCIHIPCSLLSIFVSGSTFFYRYSPSYTPLSKLSKAAIPWKHRDNELLA